jgi:hypothetical protein
MELLSFMHSINWKFHPNNLFTSNYHPKVHLCSMFIQIFHVFGNVIHVHVVFIWHNSFGMNFIHTFHPKNSFTCNYHPKNSLMFNFHLNISSILWLSSMCMWKNIFHIIPTWHRDTLRIFYPCNQNIPNIFVHAHRLMFTSWHSCSQARFLTSLCNMSCDNL